MTLDKRKMELAEEIASQATMEILKLRDIIVDITAENDRLRATICKMEKLLNSYGIPQNL